MGREEHRTHHATKSMFYGELKDSSQEKDYPNKDQSNPAKKKKKHSAYDIKPAANSFENLKIADIDSMINLIDHCVA